MGMSGLAGCSEDERTPFWRCTIPADSVGCTVEVDREAGSLWWTVREEHASDGPLWGGDTMRFRSGKPFFVGFRYLGDMHVLTVMPESPRLTNKDWADRIAVEFTPQMGVPRWWRRLVIGGYGW